MKKYRILIVCSFAYLVSLALLPAYGWNGFEITRNLLIYVSWIVLVADYLVVKDQANESLQQIDSLLEQFKNNQVGRGQLTGDGGEWGDGGL